MYMYACFSSVQFSAYHTFSSVQFIRYHAMPYHVAEMCTLSPSDVGGGHWTEHRCALVSVCCFSNLASKQKNQPKPCPTVTSAAGRCSAEMDATAM